MTFVQVTIESYNKILSLDSYLDRRQVSQDVLSQTAQIPKVKHDSHQNTCDPKHHSHSPIQEIPNTDYKHEQFNNLLFQESRMEGLVS